VEDDRALLERWKAGDRSAGDVLFERHFDAIYSFFARKVSGDVSDLVQRTFVGLTEGRERYAGEVSPRAYLYGIARNVLYAHYRAAQRHLQLEFDVSSLHDLEPTPSGRLAGRRESRLLLEALRHIPLDLQLIVELHYWEGLSGPEIAAILALPEGTVRSRIRRALEKLRAEVERLGEGHALLHSTLTDLETWAADLEARR
jgi:RNA polymerase sigma-70 factor (ECF subfamily)